MTPEFLAALRDRIARSPSPAVRVAAVEIGGLLPGVDNAFASMMLSDSAPPVRAAVIEQLASVEERDRARAEAIVRQHTAVEQHRTVLSAGHYALGSLVSARRR